MIIDIETIIKQDLERIQLNENYKEFSEYNYWFPKTVETDSILFIGINPSYSDYKENERIKVFNICQQGNSHQYFGRMEEISENCKTKWSHLDLLYFRSKSQNDIYEILRMKNGKDFLSEQLKISDKLIRLSKPKVIVVCNTLARDLFLKLENRKLQNLSLNYEFIDDDLLGTYRWKNTPVFFSGMLSGLRALDNGSYKRLSWHIRKSLNIVS
ncbi:MAG: hypothetical protein WCL14_03920 [Bacteroidota bacterium]